MIFDTQEHRTFVLQLLAGAQFPGTAINAVYEFKQAVINADVAPVLPVSEE